MSEKSLVFVKPDGVERGLIGEVIRRFEARGLKILNLQMRTLTSELADAHYAEHVTKGFYPELKAYVMSGPIVVMVLEGANAVGAIRKMLGATNSSQAEAGTIRGDFALTTAHNIVHASDSVESAEREIKNFFG